ncbi:MAG: hypothetical protein ACHREM_12485 [Polyangiales bacterium]
MGIAAKTRKQLWGRAANRCSKCRTIVTMGGEAASPLIGQECHIVAREPEGPRGRSPLTANERDSYANLLILCAHCHIEVDSDKNVDGEANRWSVRRLSDTKHSHERWVQSTLDAGGASRQASDEHYAWCLDEWEARCLVAEWEQWASPLLSNGQPSVREDVVDRLWDAQSWLRKRAWSGDRPDLEACFVNFARVLHDLLATLNKYAHRNGDSLEIEMTHQRLKNWDEQVFAIRFQRFHFAVDLVMDLTLELTRAANLLSAQVRRDLLPTYRLREGLFSVIAGPNARLEWPILHPEYAAGTAPTLAYEGLPLFLVARFARDACFAEEEQPTIVATDPKSKSSGRRAGPRKVGRAGSKR